ncbi:MAG: ROK family protein [Anaerolineae bacterium]|jgi:glucokinase|nr:ROK family protein [Anaerolineae bacterium]MDH7473343.1 ROK family protein [Anaerolineae bacterium]
MTQPVHFIGVDLGGTTITGGAVNVVSGQVLGRQQIPTLAKEGHDAVMARMVDLVHTIIADAALSKEDIGGIGVGLPGVLDMERGITLFLPNLPGAWRNVPLKATMEAGTGLPTYMLNDVRSFTLGEKTFGAGREVHTMFGLAIGTGIGGGMVINGQLHLGLDGTAGEVGHQIIDPYGPPCGCGSHGCLEAFASGPAITAMALKAITQGLTTKIAEMVDYDLNKVTPEIVCRAAQAGDPIAIDIYERAGFYIGVGVANLITIISPQMVVIGGGVAQAGELLFAPIRRTVQERVHVTPLEKVQIVPAQLGTSAGLIGAAVWASLQTALGK